MSIVGASRGLALNGSCCLEMTNMRTLLHECNPISLCTAMVQDNNDLVSFMLKPNESSVLESQNDGKFKFSSLYRHKRSIFQDVLYVVGMGPTHKGISEKLSKRYEALSGARIQGAFKKWLTQLAYRSFLVSYRRGIKSMVFNEPPEFKLLWTDSGNSVVLNLNGEPWAFFEEKSCGGYSKGVLKPEAGNLWNQELFEKTFKDA